MIQTKKIILSGLLVALGVLIPIFFHMLGAGGAVFLPMHLPVMVTGFLVGPLFGLIVGTLTPFISSLLTGMPPLFPMAVLMIFELSAYGFICGFLYEKMKRNVILSLIGAMLGGRIVLGLIAFIMVQVFGVSAPSLQNPITYVWSSIVTGLPGILIQIVLVPVLIALLKKSKLISEADHVAS